jgi:dUTP pyrophosphatase
MGYDINEMRKKLLDAFDSNTSYSIDDFTKEFNGQIPLTEDNNYKISLLFKNESTNPDPEYATAGSSGFDLRANLTKPIEIGGKLSSNNIKIIPTGLFFEIPDNFEIQIRPRSGLAAKNGITVLNTPGTIDADYRGEIKIILVNHRNETFIVNHGDRIAQGVMAAVTGKNYINLVKVNNISEDTERGIGGFGSTGTK